MRLIPIVLASLSLFLVQTVHATLGEKLSSVAASDAKFLRAKAMPDEANAGGTCHRLVNGRSSICQYADASGQVYAVTWHGQGHPDLASVNGRFVLPRVHTSACGSHAESAQSHQFFTYTKSIYQLDRCAKK